ncbi:MAG TPA: thiosulfate oxidation carrier complex protein SoxZ [Hyphomicrobiaceae bacterium]|jgi:sulfur-oxidizing protein SoxZ|nr:thiosulfate oxidation carrier complex protein SoxZ [Hyphomicrobiaceae bacterium]
MAKPRVKVPRTAAKDEIITIKTLISHTMESGQRKDRKTGEKIPRKIINKFTATFNGKQVFGVDVQPGVSANPFLQFTVKVPESGEFEFVWVDDDGTTYKDKKSIKVG